jgi:hypothetical protein
MVISGGAGAAPTDPMKACRSGADMDENAHLGAWERCAECNRKYRPINIWGCCYDCRYAYGLPLITDR